VLVDGGTAGAAEVVAAALHDAGAPVVGQRSFGRVPLQRLVALNEGALLLTVGKYVSPKGRDIHAEGVEPTVTVERPDEHEAGSPARDLALEKAVEILTTGGEAKQAA
jgi:carboxyl-terminal processing protease